MMTPTVSSFLFFLSLTLIFPARAQERAPHGLVYENPVAFSPSAVDFFRPKAEEPHTPNNPCEGDPSSSSCSPLPLLAHVEATPAQESKISTTQKSRSRLGAGAIAGIVLGLAFTVLLAMGAYHALVTRRANINRANTVQPDA